MESLQAPDFSVSDVLERIRTFVSVDEEICQRIENSIPEALAYSDQLDASMLASAPETFPQSATCAQLEKEELLYFYANYFARERGVARRYYNGILGLAKNDRCPFCRVGVVTTVDHYLPKSKYTNVCLAPMNLIPCCRDCNFYKGTRFPHVANDHFLHPYFDDFSDQVWLCCELEFGQQLKVSFSVNSNGAYDPDVELRLRNHFNRLRLNRLFISNAMNQLVNEKNSFELYGNAVEANWVRDSLQRSLETYTRQAQNSWQTALYRALLASNAYQAGGWASL